MLFERRRRDSNPWSGFCRPVPYQLGYVAGVYIERAKRFELSTFSLARRRSTTELHPRFLGRFRPSAERQNRTDDTAIFSRVLYQLSYLGENIQLLSEWYSTSTYSDCQHQELKLVGQIYQKSMSLRNFYFCSHKSIEQCKIRKSIKLCILGVTSWVSGLENMSLV